LRVLVRFFLSPVAAVFLPASFFSAGALEAGALEAGFFSAAALGGILKWLEVNGRGSRKRCLDEADEVGWMRGWAWWVLVLMVGGRKKRIEGRSRS